jgi:hypothetical protein
MKTIALFLCSAVMFLWLTPAVAQAQPYYPGTNGFIYADNVTGLWTVAGFDGINTNSVLTIPTSDSIAGFPSSYVTAIGETAFADDTNLISVTIPGGPSYFFGGITYIGPEAFIGCTSLTNVTLGGVQEIGYSAFEYCDSLSTLVIPANVTTIDSYAFSYCTNLTTLYFEGNAPTNSDSTLFYEVNNTNTVVYYQGGTTGWGNNLAGVRTVAVNPTVASEYVPAGSNATLTVTNTGGLPSTYQWYFTNPALQTPAVAVPEVYNGFVYGALVYSGGSGYTTVPNVYFIYGSGQGAGGIATITNGSVVAITMTNANTGYTNPPTVVIDPPNGLLIGQTNATLSVPAITTNNLGGYYVVIANAYSSVTSSVATLAFGYPPSFSQQPTNQFALSGSTVDFNVTLAGTPPFGYQWWETGAQQTNAGATPTVLGGFVVGVNITNNGAGYVWVPAVQFVGGSGTGAGGVAVLSNQTVIAITITNAGIGYSTPPTIQIAPPTPVALIGQTSGILALRSVNSTNAADYYVVVTNNFGSVTSLLASLTIAPTGYNLITGTLLSGGNVSLSFSGQPNVNYALDRSYSLVPANWVPQVTNPAAPSGLLVFTNLANPATNNFWRIRSVP